MLGLRTLCAERPACVTVMSADPHKPTLPTPAGDIDTEPGQPQGRQTLRVLQCFLQPLLSGYPPPTHTPKLKPRNGKSFLPNEFSLV